MDGEQPGSDHTAEIAQRTLDVRGRPGRVHWSCGDYYMSRGDTELRGPAYDYSGQDH